MQPSVSKESMERMRPTYSMQCRWSAADAPLACMRLVRSIRYYCIAGFAVRSAVQKLEGFKTSSFEIRTFSCRAMTKAIQIIAFYEYLSNG